MAGFLSKDIKFYLGTATYTASTDTWTITKGNEVFNLQEIPSLGGSPEKVEVTCLADGARKYITGIKDYGDLAFKFLYDNSDSDSNYRVLKAKEGTGAVGITVEFPDALTTGSSAHHGTTFAFAAEVSVAVDGVGVNAAPTFTCNCALQSDITVTNPA